MDEKLTYSSSRGDFQAPLSSVLCPGKRRLSCPAPRRCYSAYVAPMVGAPIVTKFYLVATLNKKILERQPFPVKTNSRLYFSLGGNGKRCGKNRDQTRNIHTEHRQKQKREKPKAGNIHTKHRQKQKRENHHQTSVAEM